MASDAIVIDSEFFQLPCQIDGIPEENTIKVLTPNRADQSFNERMENRNVRDRLDLLNPEHAQVREPTVIAPG